MGDRSYLLRFYLLLVIVLVLHAALSARLIRRWAPR